MEKHCNVGEVIRTVIGDIVPVTVGVINNGKTHRCIPPLC